jgi:hypothetical protein
VRTFIEELLIFKNVEKVKIELVFNVGKYVSGGSSVPITSMFTYNIRTEAKALVKDRSELSDYPVLRLSICGGFPIHKIP